jgi:hypothetical protein
LKGETHSFFAQQFVCLCQKREGMLPTEVIFSNKASIYRKEIQNQWTTKCFKHFPFAKLGIRHGTYLAEAFIDRHFGVVCCFELIRTQTLFVVRPKKTGCLRRVFGAGVRRHCFLPLLFCPCTTEQAQRLTA